MNKAHGGQLCRQYWCLRGTYFITTTGLYLSQQLDDDLFEGGARDHHLPGQGRDRGGASSRLNLRGGGGRLDGARVRWVSERTWTTIPFTRIVSFTL